MMWLPFYRCTVLYMYTPQIHDFYPGNNISVGDLVSRDDFCLHLVNMHLKCISSDQL